MLDIDSADAFGCFEDATEFVENARKSSPKSRVLVHCFAGKSRASANTIAYLIKKMRITLKKSMAHVKKCRPIADPNRGFRI